MTNNDILRRLRYALSLNDADMIAIFANMSHQLPSKQLRQIMAKETEDDYQPCDDTTLAMFLDGLIIKHRGLKTPGQLPAKVDTITKNEMLMKMRIALELKAEDIIAILALVDFRLSKSELSALFRKSDHRNYKACGDQILRNFLNGLTTKLRK